MNSDTRVDCIHCNYDLRATPLTANCPECGKPAEHSKLGYRVEGKYLVVRPRARLPFRCVKTNRPILTDAHAKRVPDQACAVRGVRLVAVTRILSPQAAMKVLGGVLIGISWNAIALWNSPLTNACLTAVVVATGFMLALGSIRFRGRSVDFYVTRHVLLLGIRDAVSISLVSTMAISVPMLALTMMSLAPPPTISYFYQGLSVLGACAVFAFNVLWYRRVKNGECWLSGCCDEYLKHCADERARLLNEQLEVGDARESAYPVSQNFDAVEHRGPQL